MEDEKILILLQTAPETGLWELTRKYGGLASMVISRILCGRPEDTEECVADTFVRIWKNCDGINLQNGNIKGYVICAARSIAIDRYRKIKKEFGNTAVEEYMPDDSNLCEEVESDNNLTTIKTEISKLSYPDKEIFLRRYFLYQSIKEIADIMQMGEKAIESRLFRGRKKLRVQLQEKGVLV